MIFSAIQCQTKPDFEKNLKTLKKLIQKSGDIVVAPEVVLTGFAYDRFEEAASFGQRALEELLPLSQERIVCYTQIEKRDGKFYNIAKVLYKEEVVYEQPKVKLFKFGGETDYFSAGNIEQINLFEIEGRKFGLLICFELRFIEIWQRLKGADIILVPAMWGSLRKRHFEQFTETLALMHQCFVIASNSANEDMAKSSAIINPFGVAFRDDRKRLLNKEVDLNDIKKMRRYMDIGL
ncbi:carbon-nitrogen hydrolase family protein [Nitratiruptor tergarcus]|uniref:Predicted amidohydrolase n=1 Tax=Nitratiruptor tergarcus DSM 16512 TaxID=1069081 RepID=A0A1W1WQW7_9BACT|nr:carbon-nitrogen hydrolase family protein [Nitratiruptor tergarcus]SMC08708.1 Predicted amidohydrolase [Nitratiruptor tergarcus DSM 16512]